MPGPARGASGTLVGGGDMQMPMSPLPVGMQSPLRKMNVVKQNVFVSPMRSDKAAASHMTPRSKAGSHTRPLCTST